MSSEISLYQEQRAFRRYISDTAYWRNKGMAMKYSFSEILDGVKVDERTGDEIAESVINELGLEVKH